MGQRSKKYWEDRANERMAAIHKDSDKTIAAVNSAYDKSIQELNDDIDSIFINYMISSEISQQEAEKLLNAKIPNPLIRIFNRILRRIKNDYIRKVLLARLNANAYKARITRLEAVKESIYINAKQIADVELYLSTQSYINTIKQSYYKTIFDIQRVVGLGFSFATVPKSTVEEILKNNWSGKHYSKRIWDNTDALASKLEEVITSGVMRGKSSQKMAAEIQDMTAYGKFAAERLIRTETTYFTNESEQKSYEECGIDKFLFVATLDSRTSPQCRAHDGKLYYVSQRQTGVNVPPLHTYCRSTTTAYFGKKTMENLTRRARDPATAKTYVIKNMTYNEWHKKYVGEISS